MRTHARSEPGSENVHTQQPEKSRLDRREQRRMERKGKGRQPSEVVSAELDWPAEIASRYQVVNEGAVHGVAGCVRVHDVARPHPAQRPQGKKQREQIRCPSRQDRHAGRLRTGQSGGLLLG